MGVKFRLINERDVRTVIAIENMCFPEPWEEEVFEIFAEMGSEIHHGPEMSVMRVVEQNEEIVGYVLWNYHYRKRLGHILNIAVRTDLQGRGIGREILKYALNQLREIGAEEVYLEVRESNSRAIRLYETFGMKASGRIEGYYSNEDAIVYSIKL